MPTNARSRQRLILLDDLEVYFGLIRSIKRSAAISTKLTATKLNAGAGFARGLSFDFNGVAYTILCLNQQTSAPFSYLTLGAFATQQEIASVLAISGAHSLREDLLPGDIAVVARASALLYPALHSNRDPYEANPPKPQHFEASPEAQSHLNGLLQSHSANLWQREIPQVHCGYTKHPTWQGELMPWAPEQFAALRQQGIDTLSSAAVGVYEAQHLMPDAQIICLNQIRSNPNIDSPKQWQKYRARFHHPLLSLLLKYITQRLNAQTNA